MILTTRSGDYPIPPEVAQLLPTVPPLPDPEAGDQMSEFEDWLDASPEHTISYERLKRWHLVQEDLAAAAKQAGRPFVVTDDGLE